MARSGVYRKLAYSGIVVTTVVGMNSSAFAAACVRLSNLSSVDISGFTANPAALLEMSDPLVLSSHVRALVGSSNDALSPVIEQAKKADAAQMAAIGAGLGRAANSCQVTDPQFKLAIEKAVAEAASADPNLAPLLAAFAKVLAEGGTAALGPGGSAAAAASGIGNNGSIGRTGPGADDGTPFEGAATTAGTLQVSNAGSDSDSSSTTTTTTATIIVSTGSGGQSSTDTTQSTSQSVPVIQ